MYSIRITTSYKHIHFKHTIFTCILIQLLIGYNELQKHHHKIINR